MSDTMETLVGLSFPSMSEAEEALHVAARREVFEVRRRNDSDSAKSRIRTFQCNFVKNLFDGALEDGRPTAKARCPWKAYVKLDKTQSGRNVTITTSLTPHDHSLDQQTLDARSERHRAPTVIAEKRRRVAERTAGESVGCAVGVARSRSCRIA